MRAEPFIVGVGGFASNVGKTTLMCELLAGLAGWEAIKTTRGHYRSCGKDPQACCVSHLLNEEATVRSGREETYEQGKDTGFYWEAGAKNVHWVIATEDQIGDGIKQALGRVKSPGVLIEGNTFSEYVSVNFMIMVTGSDPTKIKRSARNSMARCSAFYIANPQAIASFVSVGVQSKNLIESLPVYTQREVPELINRIRNLVPNETAGRVLTTR